MCSSFCMNGLQALVIGKADHVNEWMDGSMMECNDCSNANGLDG
jgi:hypothetical protein